MNKNNKGLSSLMLLAMMAFAFIIIFLFSITKNKNAVVQQVKPTAVPVSKSTDSNTVKSELNQTEVGSPEQELLQLEAELESL